MAVLDADAKNGKVALKADGSFVYTPNATSSGPTRSPREPTFTYKVTNGAATSTPGTVTIVVK